MNRKLPAGNCLRLGVLASPDFGSQDIGSWVDLQFPSLGFNTPILRPRSISLQAQRKFAVVNDPGIWTVVSGQRKGEQRLEAKELGQDRLVLPTSSPQSHRSPPLLFTKQPLPLSRWVLRLTHPVVRKVREALRPP